MIRSRRHKPGVAICPCQPCKRRRKAERMAHPSGYSRYGRKRAFLTAENRRRSEAGLPAVMGMDYPIGRKPWQ